MKLHDFIFRFHSMNWLSKEGICRVRLFLGPEGGLYVVLTELEENPSASVTNAIELIHAQLCRAQKIPPQAKVIEHYPRSPGWSQTFDLVTWKDGCQPVWTSVSRKTVEAWLGADQAEFSDEADPRVRTEIRQALEGIPKINIVRPVERPEVTERRLEITTAQHSRQELLALLDQQPAERQLAAFLKEDPSFFGERYAYPAEEYICFSEFPVGDTGRVDFAPFTGRSWMRVYLIELKDGRTPLRRKNHYGAFRAQIEEGREQLLRRAAWVERNYDAFRRFVHQVRQETEAGRRPYGAFPGPKWRLQVDPNKDLSLRLVLIGGRTTHDLADSQARYREDASSRYHLETETWDSWANKLTRD